MSKNNNQSHSPKSQGSLQSVGIGDQVPTQAVQDKPKPRDQQQPKPLPEGILQSNDPVYDCIVYIIYCPEHQKIAVTNVDKCKCVWLPFVALPQSDAWKRASCEGVAVLIGQIDPEMDEQVNRITPDCDLTYRHILRLQMPSRKVITRLTLFACLKKNNQENATCCINTNRVNWLPVADIQQNRVAKVWGPELRILTAMLAEPQPQIVNEFSLNHTLYYWHLDGSWQQDLLKAFKLTESHVHEIYTDFIEHCYPSFYMCLESFHVYFLKYGLVFNKTQIGRLFNAFCLLADDRRLFLDFHEFLIALITMEPQCSNKLEARLHLIFRYYDLEQKGQLSTSNVCIMLKDASPKWSDAKIAEEARLYMNKRPFLNYQEFAVTFRPTLGNLLYAVCRLPRSMLSQISSLMASKTKERRRQNQACEGVLKARRVTKGTCLACRAQQYEYGNHCVTIDTLGRCVEPNLIPVTTGHANKSSNAAPNAPQQQNNSIGRSRYSLEYVFPLGSVPNIFLDMIRDFHENLFMRRNTAAPVGILTSDQEWHTLDKYFRVMCNDLCGILEQERKLVKLNAPAIVVGDVRGNLRDMMQLEKLFWPSFPVIPEKLVFLGNYSDDGFAFGLECLIYLFALKLISPNKVVLLRGANELGVNTCVSLKKQCVHKYGTEHGTIIYGTVLQIFAKLPVAVLVDESVLCTHSGIPTASRLAALHKAPADMASLARESPMAYEIVTRYPKNTGTAGKTSGVGKSADSLGGTNVSKVLFGGKVGDQQHHTSFKSTTKSKSASLAKTLPLKPKSVKSIQKVSSAGKSVPYVCKSPKSLKSLKSLKSVASAHKSNKSLKSLKSLVRSGMPKSADSTKSNKSLKSLKSTGSLASKNCSPSSAAPAPFQLQPKSGSKLKPTFLAKSYRTNPKIDKEKQASKTSSAKSNKSAKFPDKKAKPQTISLGRRDKTYDAVEFAGFMEANDLAYLIRSGSMCQNGFKISYQNCVSIFSCSNHAKRNNQAAVALIDGSNHSVRVINHSTSCVVHNPIKPKTNK